MHILMISDVYFPRVNGVSTSIATFSREFREQGHTVTLIAPDYGKAQEKDDDIIRIPSRYLLLDPEDRIMKVAPIRALTATLRMRCFDIVHVQTPFVAHYAGLRLSKRLYLPKVESYHTLFEDYLEYYARFFPASLIRLATRRLSRWQCNQLDAIVAPSTAMREQLEAYGVTAKIAVIPTGIELRDFASGDGARFRHRFAIARDRPSLVFIGRVAFEKNIGFLLDMLVIVRRVVSNVLLVVAGEGPARHWLERRARQLGLEGNVLFVGYLSRKDGLLDCYCAADIFVFASRTETQGLVLLEAMALGTPVVSTAVMGTRDTLKGCAGALVAEDDPRDFARKVLDVLKSPELRQRLSIEGRQFVRRSWSARVCARRLLDFYRQVIDSAPRGHGQAQ